MLPMDDISWVHIGKSQQDLEDNISSIFLAEEFLRDYSFIEFSPVQ